MKLVDILARELKEWPEGAQSVDQSVVDRELYGYSADDTFMDGLGIFLSELSDNPNEEVTRAQWQEAREALSRSAEFPSLAAKMCGIDMRESDASANSEQPNWDEAPDGFDYFILWPHKSYFYRLIGDRYVRDNGRYALVSDVAGNPEIIVMKRQVAHEKAWNGEGLPPVGMFCEAKNDISGEWDAVDEVLVHTIIGGAPTAVCKRNDRVFLARVGELRPIRTLEQIAAEERKQSIDEMCLHGVDAGDSTIEYTCAALYDAGYRKVNDGNQKA